MKVVIVKRRSEVESMANLSFLYIAEDEISSSTDHNNCSLVVLFILLFSQEESSITHPASDFTILRDGGREGDLKDWMYSVACYSCATWYYTDQGTLVYQCKRSSQWFSAPLAGYARNRNRS